MMARRRPSFYLKIFFIGLAIESFVYTAYTFWYQLITNYVFVRADPYGLHIANFLILNLLFIFLLLNYDLVKAFYSFFYFVAAGELFFNALYIVYYHKNLIFLRENKPFDYWVYAALVILLFVLCYVCWKLKLAALAVEAASLFFIPYLLVWVNFFGIP